LNCGEAGYRHYDPKKAKALLADYGKPVSLEMIHTTTPRGREFGEVLQQLYRKIGVDLKLNPVDQNTLVKRVYGGEYQISGWRIADVPDIGPQLYSLHHSDSSYNLTKHASPELDTLVESMRVEKDAETRNGMLCQIAEEMNTSGHIQYRGGNHYYIFTRPWVKNVDKIFMGAIDLSTATVEK
jgi:ABC-type transport system substrate-binding protein